MIAFRWTVAGGKEFPFQDDAVKEIYSYSKGNPREIVKLANESLIRAVVKKTKVVGKDLVSAAESELISV